MLYHVCDTFGLFNNKGGVGKTTLSFQMICEFARKHPDKIVAVVDMCPQANLSQTLLTHSYLTNSDRQLVMERGDYKVKDQTLKEDADGFPKTVAGVVCKVAAAGFLDSGKINEYFMRVHDTNPRVPNNILLLCGDAGLDSIAPGLSDEAQKTPMGTVVDPFWDVHTRIKRVLAKLPVELGRDVYGFVDTNPALTVYTHIALCAMTKVVLPMNNDEYSATAVRDVLTRVYATSAPPVNALSGMYDKSFEYKIRHKYSADSPGCPPSRVIEMPKIHMLIMNKMSLSVGTAEAQIGTITWKKAVEIMKDALYEEGWGRVPGIFSPRQAHVDRDPANRNWDLYSSAFLTNYLFFMSDLASAGSIGSTSGVPIFELHDQKNRPLLENLKREFSARGVKAQMLRKAQVFIEYLVHHMTNERPNMPRTGRTIKQHLIPEEIWAGNPQLAPPTPAAGGFTPPPPVDDDNSDDDSDGGNSPGAAMAASAPGQANASLAGINRGSASEEAAGQCSTHMAAAASMASSPQLKRAAEADPKTLKGQTPKQKKA